ncbi:transport and Golgi organization protein 6 homolog [Anthonomus grandis grandis]|uniref:transport and Golgi organization protein 6 homolog n=1 Tax=Anthonomus grandis grandis TaxID=2921223 RepID=UPI0021659A99|nr:transport and Golgi organization protein 6 homolog [Anthonomus grandis grandis]
MEKSELVKLLSEIRISELTETKCAEEITLEFEKHCQAIYDKLGNFDSTQLNHITKYYFSDPNIPEWRYLFLNFYIIQEIGNIVTNSQDKVLLSVKETKILKDTIIHLTRLGIYSKLQPKLPFYIKKQYTKTEDIFFEYNVLKCTVLTFCDILKNEHLRAVVLTESLRGILTALYQIAYCPLRNNTDNHFTEEVFKKLVAEKRKAEDLLLKLKETIHPQIYIKETMIILQKNAPVWFKKAVSQMLTDIMLSSNGVENISIAMLEGTGNDNTKTWKALDVIYRLISSCKNQIYFRENILQQVVKLKDKASEDNFVFERLFVSCTKRFYAKDQELSKEVFVRPVITFLLHFVMRDYPFKEKNISNQLKQSLRLLHAIFVEKTVESACLPIEMIKPVLSVIFKYYSITLNKNFKDTNLEAKEVLLKFLNDYSIDEVVFDNFLFGISDSENILAFRSDIELKIAGNEVVVKHMDHQCISSPSDNFETIQKLLESDVKLLTRLFKYLLKCFGQREKYFKKANEELLNLESDVMTEYFERRLVVVSALSVLADNKKVQKEIIDSPGDIVCFIIDVLYRTIESNMHKTEDFESDEFQTMFTVVMILNALIANHSKKTLKTFKSLCEPLKVIQSEAKHKELIDLIGTILKILETEKTTKIHIEDRSEIDLILEDICDPLLPVRAHGIMALKKLVEQKNPSVMEKKQYILTIFQQNLKNEDSYIYLSAVDGLAAMATIFSDTVIKTLCEEYSDFAREGDDGHEVRIKLGEVLVRVTKILGDMAPKYKAILLNTFLIGTKDEDHLIRASSLSNLGEICRVLGYKLGTVVTEVLVCVHAIIATDKAIEARRAAVTVIRQLLAGLESEMIAFLKEEILPIYRTLKEIYHDDRDDVMRLQAQLALEELNENMKNFVFPKPELNMEKKIIMLN